MKYIVGFLFIFALSFGNSSCQKEFFLDEIDSTLITLPKLPGVTGHFTAMIDGVKFTADKLAGASRSFGVINITGISNTGETIILAVADSGVHIYTLDIETMINVGVYMKKNEDSYGTNGGDDPSQSGGTLSVTSIDTDKKTISGKFSIIVFRPFDQKQKKITEGVFKDISYETQPVPPANTKDTFRVKIDGTSFPVYSIVGVSINNTFFKTLAITVNNQAANKTVGLTMPSDVKPGTYNYTPADADFRGQYNPTSSTFLVANSGKMIILEHNKTTKRIKGNFNFEAKEITGSMDANLTEGYFSITYQ